MQDLVQNLNECTVEKRYQNADSVVLYRDHEKVLTLTDDALRLFYNQTYSERNLQPGSIIQDLPESSFNDIRDILISIRTEMQDEIPESILDIECYDIYPHSRDGIALFKQDLL